MTLDAVLIHRLLNHHHLLHAPLSRLVGVDADQVYGRRVFVILAVMAGAIVAAFNGVGVATALPRMMIAMMTVAEVLAIMIVVIMVVSVVAMITMVTVVISLNDQKSQQGFLAA